MFLCGHLLDACKWTIQKGIEEKRKTLRDLDYF